MSLADGGKNGRVVIDVYVYVYLCLNMWDCCGGIVVACLVGYAGRDVMADGLAGGREYWYSAYLPR
jgi:hypothetical protein